jgi:hypothetical protein
MDENEYLTHIAAGTDPITALAAEEKPPANHGCAWFFALIAMALATIYLMW